MKNEHVIFISEKPSVKSWEAENWYLDTQVYNGMLESLLGNKKDRKPEKLKVNWPEWCTYCNLIGGFEFQFSPIWGIALAFLFYIYLYLCNYQNDAKSKNLVVPVIHMSLYKPGLYIKCFCYSVKKVIFSFCHMDILHHRHIAHADLFMPNTIY